MPGIAGKVGGYEYHETTDHGQVAIRSTNPSTSFVIYKVNPSQHSQRYSRQYHSDPEKFYLQLVTSFAAIANGGLPDTVADCHVEMLGADFTLTRR